MGLLKLVLERKGVDRSRQPREGTCAGRLVKVPLRCFVNLHGGAAGVLDLLSREVRSNIRAEVTDSSITGDK